MIGNPLFSGTEGRSDSPMMLFRRFLLFPRMKGSGVLSEKNDVLGPAQIGVDGREIAAVYVTATAFSIGIGNADLMLFLSRLFLWLLFV